MNLVHSRHQHLRLYFTPPRYFSDINEMCPFVCKEVTPKEYLRHFYHDDFLKPEYKYRKDRRLFTGTYSEFVSIAKTDSGIIGSIGQCIRSACSSLERNFKSVMSKHVGVSCMSKVATSNLMWAHYADSHRGLCIGFSFDVSDIILIDNKEVKYRDTKVHLPSYFVTLTNEDRNPYYAEIAFSKGEEWSYEKEHRYVADLGTCKTEKRGCKTYYYQDIDKRDVKQVVLGIQCDLEDEVINIIKKNMDVPILKCAQEGDSFSLEMRPTT